MTPKTAPKTKPQSRKVCDPCARIRDETLYTLWPTRVVHPRDGTPRLWDIYCEAICPTCGTLWRHGRDNKALIVA